MIQEQETLLRWIKNQPAPVMKTEIENSSPPGYTPERLRVLFEEGYISRKTKANSNGSCAMAYFISDKGREALQELNEKRSKESEKKREKRNELFRAVALLFIGAIISQLVEHFPDIIRAISAAFH